MKLSENVEVESNEAKASNSRVSRMARYSAAAAGLAAVSSIEIDAAIIIRDLGGPNAMNPQGSTLDVSEMAGANAGTDVLSFQSSAWGRKTGSVEAFTGRFFGNSAAIGSTATGGNWTSGGYMGSNFPSFSQAFVGFRVAVGPNSYKYGYVQIDGSNSARTFQHWGYESVANQSVITQAGAGSPVPDSGPGVVGLALLGVGAAGVRLLRKLRAGK